MPATSLVDAPAETAPPPIEKPSGDTRQRTRRKRQPPFAVVLHNDDLNTMQHVIGVLRKVFGFDLVKAYALMHQAHTCGRCMVWSGPLEVAELKADQVRSAGPDPVMKMHGATALSVSIEPLAG